MESVPDYSLALICVLCTVPLLIAICAFMRKGVSIGMDVTTTVLGYGLTVALTLLITAAIKVFVGEPRPCFYAMAMYDPVTGTCNASAARCKDSRVSFPSGHSSFSFCAFAYLAMHFNHRFFPSLSKLLRSTYTPVLIAWMPLVAAFLIASTRLRDYRHHYADVVGGAVIGLGVAVWTYNSVRKRAEELDSDLTLPSSVPNSARS